MDAAGSFLLSCITGYTLAYTLLFYAQLEKPLYLLPLFILLTGLLWLVTGKFHLYIPAALLCAAALPYIYFYCGNMPDGYLYLLAFLAFLFYILHIYRTFRCKSRENLMSRPFFVLAMFPFCLILMTVAFLLPKSSMPLTINKLDDLYNNFYEKHAVIFTNNNNLFNDCFNVIGGSLDGPAFPNNLKVISVKANTPVYLKCTVKDNYTGFNWSNLKTGAQPLSDNGNELQTQSFEMQTGLSLLSGKKSGSYQFLKENDLTITYRQVFIKYLFTPSNVISIDAGGNPADVDPYGIVTLRRRHTSGFSYNVKSVAVDYSSPVLKNFLQKSRPGFYSSLNSDHKNKTLNQFASRAEEIEKDYTQLPDNISQRVRDLAVQITRGQKTNFDKAKAIEQYLGHNERYNLCPPKRPAGHELTDYFLFESHQGYCTSYATSMTVLLRALGIPARFCEGFVMPNDPDGSGIYNVTNMQAHAWVEVYFEGFGWLPFDPTIIYTNSFYQDFFKSTSKSGSKQQPVKIEISSNPAPETSQEVGQPVVASQISPSSVPSSAPSSSSKPAAPPRKQAAKPGPKYLFIWLLAALLPALFLICFILVNSRRPGRFMKNAAKLPRRESIRQLFGYYLRFLKIAQLERKKDETADEYAKRVQSGPNRLTDFQKITEIFNQARYGCDELSEKDYQTMLGYRQTLQDWYIAQKGKARYILYHNIFGLI